MTKVLSTPEAIASADRMRQIITDGLGAELSALEDAAGQLSDPAVWDGPHAQRFRSEWQAIAPNLRRTQADLAALRDWIHQVADSILVAGGT